MAQAPHPSPALVLLLSWGFLSSFVGLWVPLFFLGFCGRDVTLSLKACLRSLAWAVERPSTWMLLLSGLILWSVWTSVVGVLMPLVLAHGGPSGWQGGLFYANSFLRHYRVVPS